MGSCTGSLDVNSLRVNTMMSNGRFYGARSYRFFGMSMGEHTRPGKHSQFANWKMAHIEIVADFSMK